VDRIVCCSVLEHLTGADQKRALSEMARVLAPGGVIGLTFDYGTGAAGVNCHLPPPHEPPENANEVRSRYVHSGLEILGGFTLDDPVPGSLFRTQEVSYTIGALFLGKAPLQKPPAPAPVHRESSILSCCRIPDLIVRLQEKARHDVSRLEAAKAFRQAAGERLVALEDADRELRRLYPELKLREQTLLEEKVHSEDRLKAVEAAHAELQRLYAELNRREKALFEMQAFVSSLGQQRNSLESELLRLKGDITALRSEGLLSYLRRRWGPWHPGTDDYGRGDPA
jgi:SAM-dependent methyltransferase